MRITSTTCEGGGTGSGFLLDAKHVVTVSHVINAAQAVTVRRPDGKVSRGEVIGTDSDREVALIELQIPLQTTKKLHFADQPPDVLDDVVAIGYPLGRPVSVTKGEVNGLDRRVDISDGPTVSGLIQFNADINHGSSGGPLINNRGEVVGLVEAETDGANGLYYAVPAKTAKGLVESWLSNPEVPDVLQCPDSYSSVKITSIHPDAASVALTLRAFVSGINAAHADVTFADGTKLEGYKLASQQLTGRLRNNLGEVDTLAQAFEGFTIEDVELLKVDNPGPLTDTSDVRWKLSAPADESGAGGDSCEIDHVRFTLRLDSGNWKLDDLKSLSDPKSCEGS